MGPYKDLNHCLACGGAHLVTVRNFKRKTLVNNLKDGKFEWSRSFPLVVRECPSCSHQQLSIAVDPELMFSTYLYQTGTSDSHLKFFEKFASSIGAPKCWTRILDIGCNDGSMLGYFKDLGWQCYGIEPATNLAVEAMQRGLHITCDFFPTEHVFNERFHCITAFNVFAHNGDPKAFLDGMFKLLNPDGRIYILTTPGRLDNYYHEHVSYFNPKSMMALAHRCNLQVASFREVSMHGLSHLFELKKPTISADFPLSAAKDFKPPVIGYGASASGVVLINHYELELEYIIDDNPLKQGKFIPGMRVALSAPIYGNKHLIDDTRDLTIVVLAHHLFDEIVRKIKIMRPNARDIFIHPLKGAL